MGILLSFLGGEQNMWRVWVEILENTDVAYLNWHRSLQPYFSGISSRREFLTSPEKTLLGVIKPKEPNRLGLGDFLGRREGLEGQPPL